MFKDVNICRLLECNVFKVNFYIMLFHVTYKILVTYAQNHLELLLRPTEMVVECKGLKSATLRKLSPIPKQLSLHVIFSIVSAWQLPLSPVNFP